MSVNRVNPVLSLINLQWQRLDDENISTKVDLDGEKEFIVSSHDLPD